MSHLLKPYEDADFLAPEEVATRLQEEFAYVDVDREQGKDIVGDTIAKLIELRAPQEIIDEQRAAQAEAIWMVVADDSTSDDDLQFTVKPNEGILIGYSSAQHEEATRTLLDRCAAALNYQIVLA